MKKIATLVLIIAFFAPASWGASFLDQLNHAMKQRAAATSSKAPAAAPQPSTNPGNSVPPATNGTWTDPSTGLTWMICLPGSTWTGSTCDTSTAIGGSWIDLARAIKKLSYGGYNDWRMPTLGELEGILTMCPAGTPGGHTFDSKSGPVRINDRCPGAPNKIVFQFMPDRYGNVGLDRIEPANIGPFWTSTQSKDDDKCLYFVVGFSYPYCTRVDQDSRDSRAAVVAVRGGSSAEFDLAIKSVEIGLNGDQKAQAAFQQELKKDRAEQDARDKAQFAAQQKTIKAMDARDKQIRANVKPGDEVIIVIADQGRRALVLAVNGDLINVQTEDDGQQLWVKRNRLHAP